MVAVDAGVPSEILLGLSEMEHTLAAYAFLRYQKQGVALEAG